MYNLLSLPYEFTEGNENVEWKIIKDWLSGRQKAITQENKESETEVW